LFQPWLRFSLSIDPNPQMQRRSVSRIAFASLTLTLLFSVLMKSEKSSAQNEQRPRARDVGVVVGVLPTGQFNAITMCPA
jgi:hypothetical protein